MSPTRAIALGSVLALSAAVLAADAPDAPTLVLTGAVIHTQTDAGVFSGTIVVRDGKIAAVGANVQLPPGAKVIDVSKCVITPGLIDAHGALGLNAAAANEGGRDANLNVLDAIDPFSNDWRDAARQGVTAVYVQPAASGSLGGSGAVLRVGPTDTADGLALRSPAGVQAALGMAPPAPVAPTSALPDFLARRGIVLPTQAQPAAPAPVNNALTRYAQYETVRGQFDAAKRYGEGKITRCEPPKDLLFQAIKGEIPIRIEIHHEDDLRNALKLASEFGLRAVFEHVERARPIPEEIRSNRAGLVIGPFLGVKPSADVRNLALDGRHFAIGTFGEPRATAGLRLHAAAAVAAGYPRDAVLRALTADAADLLGVGDRLGRIALGRTADLAVFAGDPLDPSAAVRMTISQGKVTYDAPTVETAPTATVSKPSLPEKLPPSYAIKTTRLLTSSGLLLPGELHVADGKLNGKSVVPVPLFDVGDAPVTPGFVAANVAIGGETAPDADAAYLRAVDGLAPDDGRLRACRDAGFLTAVAAPGSANVIAGMSGIVRDGDATDVGLKFVLTSAARHTERFPVSLAGQVELIDARLRSAPADTNLYLPPAVRTALLAQRDRNLDAVRERRLPAFFEVQTRAEIRAALRLIAEHKLRGVLLMPRDVEGLTDEIRQSGVAVVVGPVKPPDAERATAGLVALGKAGVPLAFGGDPAEMRTAAALLANHGLPRQFARRALTGQAADALGLPAGAGRLVAGDPADFVIWTGDPLDPTSRPAAVVAKGQRVAIGAGDDEPAKTPGRPTPAPTRPRGRGR